jgi:hypothetical protein
MSWSIKSIDVRAGSGNCQCCGRKLPTRAKAPRGWTAPQHCRRSGCERRWKTKASRRGGWS